MKFISHQGNCFAIFRSRRKERLLPIFFSLDNLRKKIGPQRGGCTLVQKRRWLDFIYPTLEFIPSWNIGRAIWQTVIYNPQFFGLESFRPPAPTSSPLTLVDSREIAEGRTQNRFVHNGLYLYLANLIFFNVTGKESLCSPKQVKNHAVKITHHKHYFTIEQSNKSSHRLP